MNPTWTKRLAATLLVGVLVAGVAQAVAPPGRYTLNGTSTVVTDEITGLRWQRVAGEFRTWENAKAYCDELVLAGSASWRLPSAPELESLTDVRVQAPFQDEDMFTTPAARYWSSTQDPADALKAFAVGSGTGVSGDAIELKTTSLRVRCVR